MHSPTISIIIPTLNSPTLTETLAAIRKISSLNYVQEVLVVGQQEQPCFPEGLPLKFIEVNQNPTPPKNRNIGAEFASGEWLFFIDSDCLPDFHWIDSFLAVLDGDRKMFSGAVDLPARMNYWTWCDHLLGFGDQVSGIFSGKFLKYTASFNFVIQKTFFKMLGGFDESFTRAGEDLDLSFRVRLTGQKITYVPNATVIHQHRRNDLKSTWRHLFQFGEGTVHLRMKYRDRWSFLQNLGYSILKMRFLGEVAGIVRVLVRACSRPFTRPKLLRYWRYLPGMVLLDLAHTLGMIYNFRVYFTDLDKIYLNS